MWINGLSLKEPERIDSIAGLPKKTPQDIAAAVLREIMVRESRLSYPGDAIDCDLINMYSLYSCTTA